MTMTSALAKLRSVFAHGEFEELVTQDGTHYVGVPITGQDRTEHPELADFGFVAFLDYDQNNAVVLFPFDDFAASVIEHAEAAGVDNSESVRLYRRDGYTKIDVRRAHTDPATVIIGSDHPPQTLKEIGAALRRRFPEAEIFVDD